MAKSKRRIVLLDEARGFAVFCMIFYHAFFLFYKLAGEAWAWDTFKFFEPIQPIFAAGFIFISGICCRLSHNNIIRGLKLLIIAIAITFISVVVLPSFGFKETEIYFGILHFLACSILLFCLLKKLLDKTPAIIGAILCIALTFVTRDIANGKLGLWDDMFLRIPTEWYKIKALIPLGIYPHDFFSADFFPLIPWIFIFLFGSFVGVSVSSGRVPSFAYKTHTKFFEALGKNALLIYITHIPIIYILIFAIQWISSQF